MTESRPEEFAKFLASKVGPDELQEILDELEAETYVLDEGDAKTLTEYTELALAWHMRQGRFPKGWKDLDTGIYRETYFDEQGNLHGTEWNNGKITKF